MSRKKETKMFSVISFIKLKRFWWNFVHRFLNKIAAKRCKRFSSHLNNVSTLPCETWNAHWTRGDYCKGRCTWCTKYATLIWRTETATENAVGQAGWCCHCGSHSSVASLIAPAQYQWCMFCTHSFAIFPTCCYELDSNLAKVEGRPQSRRDKF